MSRWVKKIHFLRAWLATWINYTCKYWAKVLKQWHCNARYDRVDYLVPVSDHLILPVNVPPNTSLGVEEVFLFTHPWHLNSEAITFMISQGQGKPLHNPEYRYLLLPHLLNCYILILVQVLFPLVYPNTSNSTTPFLLSRIESCLTREFWRSYEGPLDHTIFLNGFHQYP